MAPSATPAGNGRPLRQADDFVGLILAILLLAAGAGLGLPGLYLAALGGSWYYALCGACLIGTAVLVLRRSPLALGLYALVVLATLIWAVAEIGLDWWQLAPRGDLIFVLGLLLLLPGVALPSSDGGRLSFARRHPRARLSAALGIAAVVGLLSLAFGDRHIQAGTLPGPRASVAANYGGVADTDWTAYGRSWRGDKWSPLRQITPANAGRLKEAWRIETGDVKRPGDPSETTYEVTPLKIGDTVYLCTPHDMVLALDAETGRLRWRFDPHIAVSPHLQHLTCRGVSYHDSGAGGDCAKRILLGTNDARLLAIDAVTGKACSGFGSNGQIDLWSGMPKRQDGWYQITSAPLVARNLVILGGAIYDNAAMRMPSGVIRAFDVTTGRLVWNFDPGNPGDTTALKPGAHYSWSSPNTWSTSAADDALGLVYIPMGMGAVDEWGGRRPATTERLATTILALDMNTGKPRWIFQTVHHDLWDMDVPAQPVLVDLNLPGRGTVPALVQSTKTGNLFVLDRRTGQPLFPVTERPVPQGAVPGDWVSPTQPFSAVSLMPKRKIRESDMWGATPFDQLACRIKFRGLRYDGPFTPQTTRGTLVFPGNFGVMDWGGISVDPERQIAFAHPNYMGFVDRLVPQSVRHDEDEPLSGPADRNGPAGGSDRKGSTEHGLNPNHGAPFAVELNPFLSPLGLPCQAPPWGYVAGVDLVSGKVVYQRPNGTIRDESPIPVPIKMGVPSLGGPMTTAGGVAFMSSTLDYYLRAYDVATGRELWKGRLPAGAQATPMTYWSSASGRQFVIAVAGGHGSLGTRLGDYVIAYALPRS